MNEAPKKTLYHGEFCKMRQPVTVKVIAEEQESAKKKGSYYVTLEIDGLTRYYTSENERCGNAFKGLAGKVVAVSAEGRAEEATITVVGQPGSAMAAPTRGRETATPPPQRPTREPEPPHQPAAEADPVTEAKHFIARNRSLSIIALQSAFSVKREFETIHNWELPNETFTALYTSMLYGAGSRGVERNLPISGVTFKPLTAPAATGGVA